MKKKLRIALSTVILALISTCAHSQDMYNALMRQHNMYRLGVGFQASDPTGIVVNLLKGEFCSGNDLFASNLVWELFLGKENTVFASDKSYKTGTWSNGKWQGGVGAFYQVFRYIGNYATFQFLPGVGLQYGNRDYMDEQNGRLTDRAFGMNVFIRSEWSPQGLTLNNQLYFLTIFADLKYHKQFGESFNYLRPNFGLVIRKVR